ncbi:hypothetical protein JCM19239_5338 [Vibrio variabilis]|uniref:Uncharacterized protein n=1 Tax=Vibrio variabilis TaxID=990271 RepID=A0ABQ0JCL3_9VIBR|nr:hypothetical protein JCM19239_5338 [Vibrio variabilis]
MEVSQIWMVIAKLFPLSDVEMRKGHNRGLFVRFVRQNGD